MTPTYHIYNQDGLAFVNDGCTIDWKPSLTEVFATSCHIETEATHAVSSRGGIPLLTERRTKMTFELRDGRTLVVHLMPSAGNQPNWTSTLIVDDLVEDNAGTDEAVDILLDELI